MLRAMSAPAEPRTRNQAARSWLRPRRLGVAGGLALALLLIVVAVLEGDLPTDIRGLGHYAVVHLGAAGALGLLYLEESGVPLPVPGDVYVAYLGRLAGGDALRWLAAWLGIITVVVLGSTNLYLISRRWGGRLLEGRVAVALHLEPERVRAAERWFARWGVVTIIFGRHIPGLRVPITVFAGASRVAYPKFAASVAVSTSAWAALWLWLGGRYGPELGRFFGFHRWAVVLAGLVVVGVVAMTLVRAWRHIPATASRA